MKLLTEQNLRDDPAVFATIGTAADRTGYAPAKLMGIYNAMWRWFPDDSEQEHIERFARDVEDQRLRPFFRALDLNEPPDS